MLPRLLNNEAQSIAGEGKGHLASIRLDQTQGDFVTITLRAKAKQGLSWLFACVTAYSRFPFENDKNDAVPPELGKDVNTATILSPYHLSQNILLVVP